MTIRDFLIDLKNAAQHKTVTYVVYFGGGLAPKKGNTKRNCRKVCTVTGLVCCPSRRERKAQTKPAKTETNSPSLASIEDNLHISVRTTVSMPSWTWEPDDQDLVRRLVVVGLLMTPGQAKSFSSSAVGTWLDELSSK